DLAIKWNSMTVSNQMLKRMGEKNSFSVQSGISGAVIKLGYTSRTLNQWVRLRDLDRFP
ncbi:hypothetical protein L9F63_013915, partial [Diploptera punctata]